jgi:PTS system nitrogen regulatory IIA component
MQIKDFISEEGMVFSPSVSSKKAALELLSDSLSHQNSTLNKSKIFDALSAREKLGSTGLGEGVAIPHCRMPEIDTIYTTILKLEEGLEYDASDDKPVFFLFCLVVPDDAHDSHLQLLASLAEILDNKQLRNSILETHNAKELYQILTQDLTHLAA